MDSKTIGNFICLRRKDLDMTQQQLADRLEVTNKAVSKWETGEGYPDITIVPELCRELGVTADELLAGRILQNGNGQRNPQTNPVRLMSVKDAQETGGHKHKVKGGFLNVFCILAGVVLTILVFIIDLEMNMLYGYEVAPISFYPMYGVSVLLIIGGFVTQVILKKNAAKFSGN